MLDVLAVTVPVFLIIGAGYLAVWRSLFSQAQVDGLMMFTQSFAIPCLLFAAMTRLDLGQGFDWAMLFSYYSGTVVCFLAGLLGTRWWLGRGWEDAVAVGFAAMFSNTVLLGLPIAARAYGEDSLAPIYTIIAFHAGFCYLVGISMMEAVRAGGSGLLGGMATVGRRMSGNAIMIGVALGLAVNLSGVTVPAPAMEAIDLIARAALPAALFGLGGVLVQYRPEGDARGILLCCSVALVLHPAWTWGVATLLGLGQGPMRAAVLTAAMAPGVNAYLFAVSHGRAVRISASSVLLGTVACVFTVSGWLLVL